MSNKNDNKSLFLYTALIFFVAVLLIILSFFGQTNMQKKQPQINTSSESNSDTFGISEKAAVLSEENTALIEENSKLKSENKTLTDTNAELKSANEVLTKLQTTNDLLLSANGYYSLDNYTKALEVLKAIDYNTLNNDQKILYDNLNKNLQ